MAASVPKQLAEILDEARMLGEEIEKNGAAESPAAVANLLAALGEVHRRLAFLIGPPQQGWVIGEVVDVPGEPERYVAVRPVKELSFPGIEDEHVQALIVPDDYKSPGAKLIRRDDYEEPNEKDERKGEKEA